MLAHRPIRNDSEASSLQALNVEVPEPAAKACGLCHSEADTSVDHRSQPVEHARRAANTRSALKAGWKVGPRIRTPIRSGFD